MTKNNEEMTDKQIIENKNGFYCIEPCSEIKQLKEQLKAKEQQCEKAKQNAQDTYDLWQALIESFNILQGEKIKLEQECDELNKQLESTKGLVTVGNRQLVEALEGYNDLKNELHSKVEFIQEQRNVIDEYSKEIEMYKRCQGSRASKREEKLKQTLAEIKEIAEHCIKQDICTICDYSDKCHIEDEEMPTYDVCKLILQKINEVENE